MSEADDFNAKIIEEFRVHEGNVGGMFEGVPLLLLHTTGARSGKERINPVAYQSDGDRRVVIASKGGAPTNPDWYHNLVRNPRARIEVGTGTLDVVARVAEGDERERLWSAVKRTMPQFAEYEAKTTRQIPVVILEPAT